MRILVDTNILCRIAEPDHPQNATAATAVRRLLENGDTLHIVPQNFYEFWVVATRPSTKSGLGMTPARTISKMNELSPAFSFLSDVPAIFSQWQKLVLQYDCKGKIAHDVRLVAAMLVHGVERILTFNAPDFARFSEIGVVKPEKVSHRR
jgi:predicted nucleic acid-binding protein